MGSRTMTWTSVGGETGGHVIQFMNIPAFTGSYSIQITASVPAVDYLRFGIDLNDAPAASICHTDETVFSGGDTFKLLSGTVNSPPFAWHCLTWTNLAWYIAGPTNPAPAGVTYVLTLSAIGLPDITTIYCAYGTEPQVVGQSIVQITAQLAGQLVPEAGLWAFPIALISVGLYVAIPALCTDPPPDDPDIGPTDFFTFGRDFPGTVFQRKIAEKLKRSLWLKFCKCSPATGGGSAPVTYIDAHWEKPTWYVSDTTNIISNTDIAVTLNQLTINQTTNTIVTNNTNTLATFPSRCPPDAYEESTVHEGLVGEGRFGIGQVVGFKIEVTERPGAGLVLSGQPQYLWNMGWVSVLAGDQLLDEKRVTREGYLWFPCSIQLADEFTFTIRELVELRVTELVAVQLPALPPPF